MRQALADSVVEKLNPTSAFRKSRVAGTRTLVLVVFLVGLLCCFQTAWSQEFPTRPVTVMVGMPAGGAIDVSIRSLQPELAKILGQEVIVEDKPGGGGTVATGILARSKPDGYTLLAINSAALTNAPHVSTVTYDTLKDLIPVIQFGNLVPILVVRADSPFKGLKDVVDFARKNPGKVIVGHTGVGVPCHVLIERLNLDEKLNITTVPFDGGPPCMAAVLGGHVSICGTSINSSMQFIKSGKARALGITSSKRMDLLPEIPTLAEQGFPNLVMREMYAVVAPKGTPPVVINKFIDAFGKAMQTPAFKTYGRNTYLLVESPLAGEKLKAYIDAEYANSGEIIRKAGIKQ
jgi:tripartite-type tricarboxylate transporter receptor subunit TctC